MGYHKAMERSEFESVVNATIKKLPAQFKKHLDNVAVVIEPYPRSGSWNLLGLYEGVPVTAWGRDYSGKLPDKITLYQENIEAYAISDEEIPRVIRETLLHEIGHHFGLDHDRIGEMEKRWRKKS